MVGRKRNHSDKKKRVLKVASTKSREQSKKNVAST